MRGVPLDHSQTDGVNQRLMQDSVYEPNSPRRQAPSASAASLRQQMGVESIDLLRPERPQRRFQELLGEV
jgi:hypothetical protein